MSVVAAGERSRGFWQKLARALDTNLAGRSRQATSTVALRQSRRDIARCRRLLRKGVRTPVGLHPATVGRAAF